MKATSSQKAKQQQQWAYGITALAAASFIFVVATILFVQSSALTRLLTPLSASPYSGEDLLTVNERAEEPEIADPLITVVPEEQQSAESKTKIFVSTLDPRLGPADAKVFVILFGSFTDQTALGYVNEAQRLVEEYEEDVAVVWKDYAPQEDERARRMAAIGHCVAEQYTPEAFWNYSQALVSRTSDDDETLFGFAEAVGAPRLAVEECLTTSGFESLLNQSYAYGQTVGVSNGHIIFVNDRQLNDPLTLDELKRQIDEVLATFQTAQ